MNRLQPEDIQHQDDEMFDDNETIMRAIRALMERAHANATAKGFWESERCFAESIALMHSELSEALEADRAGNPPSEKVPKFTGIAEELGDLAIRLFDVSAHHGIPLAEVILAKMTYNESRPHKHGKKY